MLESDAPALPKDAARHLKVLRPEEGERFELFDMDVIFFICIPKAPPIILPV